MSASVAIGSSLGWQRTAPLPAILRSDDERSSSFADVVFAAIAAKPITLRPRQPAASTARVPALLSPDVPLDSVRDLNALLQSAVVETKDVAQSQPIFASVLHLQALLDSAETPVEVQAPAKPRPLAACLAVTARTNIRKGRKPFETIAKAKSRKPKPASIAVKKRKAPKRRHVWLSNQTRVVRPITQNVVHLARLPRSTKRGSGQKAAMSNSRQAA